MKPGEVIYCDYPGQFIWREPMPDRDPILTEREKTHGDFTKNAYISQELKAIFHKNLEFNGTSVAKFKVHAEALDMIALKLSRILSGQANFKDHWDDIAGYAHLGAEACAKTD